MTCPCVEPISRCRVNSLRRSPVAMTSVLTGRSPRSRSAPRRGQLARGRRRITPGTGIRISVAASLVAVLAAVPLGGLFAVGTAGVVILGWAYSMPPLRFKARPGADLMVNAVVGVLGPLGGWEAVTGTGPASRERCNCAGLPPRSIKRPGRIGRRRSPVEPGLWLRLWSSLG